MEVRLLQTKVKNFIDRERLIASGGTVVLGLSGGADSVALLHILVALGYRCIACHCNFNLRGEEAMRDSEFARSVAEQFSVPFEQISFPTRAYAEEHKLSIEMACRELRYRWFEEMRIRFGAEAIAVAHHNDDHVETLLLNLIRGTGIAGLTGISPRNGYVVRPLLCVGRADLLSYLQAVGQTYVTDSSNLETLYTRNKIRLELLPMLRAINPSVDRTLTATARYLSQVETVYRAAIGTQRQAVTYAEGETLHIRIPLLDKQPEPQALLFEILHPYGFTASQLGDIYRNRESGNRYLSATHRAVYSRDELCVAPLESGGFRTYTIGYGETGLLCDGLLSVVYCDADGYMIPKCAERACFDADKLEFPLTLRRWRQGDRFVPFGMKGSRKVSDYFSDKKYSLYQKEQAWLLCSGENILWIVGERAAEQARIDNRTRRILEISAKKC